MALSEGMEEVLHLFIEESMEGLDTMESGLLALEQEDGSADSINVIFRAAHSIKGGAATFGYVDIKEFTHKLETLLDLLRSSALAMSPELNKLLLQCVDCLREMMSVMRGGSYDKDQAAELTAAMETWLEKNRQAKPVSTPAAAEPVSAPAPAPEPTPPPAATRVVNISFKPFPEFLKCGNQPSHLFRALEELGQLTIKPDLSRLPLLGELEPKLLYLSWDLQLETAAAHQQILEVFDWVTDQCELTVTEPAATQATNQTQAPGLAAVPAPPERRVGDRRKTDRRAGAEAASVRVDISKVDALLNLVGEMVINQAMLSQYNSNKYQVEDFSGLGKRLTELERNTRELQEAVMRIRMLPVSVTFSRFPRLVHDLGAALNKAVDLVITGEHIELDKTVLEKIADPIMHLIRNSIDHGIEPAAQRLAAGKPERGTIHLSADHVGGSIVIGVADDGGGLNTEKILKKARERGLLAEDETPTQQQIHNFIFKPGFSTVDVISDVSGRGVGMDVVCNNIRDISGRLDVISEEGKGCNFQITLPLTLAIMDGQLINVNGEVYVIPLLSIVETVQVDSSKVNRLSGGDLVYVLRGEVIPIIDLRVVCHIEGKTHDRSLDNKLLMIVEAGQNRVGLIVDELMQQHQVVIKNLEKNFAQVRGILGATILGNGRVALILDIAGLVSIGMNQQQYRQAASA